MNKPTGLTCIGNHFTSIGGTQRLFDHKKRGRDHAESGEGTAELGKQWLEGESLVKKGEKKKN